MLSRLLIIVLLIACTGTKAQLQDGSIAPDFTLTDYYGTTTHNLYSYLNSGKTVFVEIFAAHCPTCWNYHQANTLKDLYNAYGPQGTDEVMVLALEYDEYNDSTAFTGNHSPWVTQGDWLTGTPYPIFNVEYPDRDVFVDYNVTYYPMVYKICPDKTTELVSTSLSSSQLYQKVQACPPLSIPEIPDLGKVYFDQFMNALHVEAYQKVESLEILDMHGQIIQSFGKMTAETTLLQDMSAGIYIYRIRTTSGSSTGKIFVE